MMKVIYISVVVVSLTAFGFFYWKSMNGSSSSEISKNTSILITHSYKDGVHRYNGEIQLPHSCYDIDPEVVHNPTGQTTHILSITAKDMLLERKICAQIVTRYPFSAISDAPQDSTISLEVNGQEVPSHVIETSWQNPTGTYLNLENKK